MRHRLAPTCLFLTLAACGGGSSAGDVAPVPGAVHVVLDTATGTDDLVQFQVGGAVLALADGTTTGNLLPAAQIVTFTDPSGELSGLMLRDVPTGDYAGLHLLLVPGSGEVLRADGARVPIAGPVDLVIPIADGLQHDEGGTSWLAVGHNGGDTVVATASGLAWQPSLAGRLDGSAHVVDGLRPVLAQQGVVTCTLPTAGDGVMFVGFADDCTFADVDGGPMTRAQFLAGIGADDDLRVHADLGRDGRGTARHARTCRRNDGPRLIGRISELQPATTSFVMRVQAETRRGGDRRLLDTPVDVVVLAANARIYRPDHEAALPFAELAVGNLAKVKYRILRTSTGGLTEVVASEIEVTSGGGGCVPPQPEWQGRVTAVDLVARTIRVEPRHGQSIVIHGNEVAVVTVVTDAQTWIQRRERHGPGRYRIELEGVVPDADRIWWRGTVTGPSSVAATWVRVRED